MDIWSNLGGATKEAITNLRFVRRYYSDVGKNKELLKKLTGVIEVMEMFRSKAEDEMFSENKGSVNVFYGEVYYVTEREGLIRFIKECTERKVGNHVKFSVVYEKYQDWCERNKCEPTNTTAFGRELSKFYKKKISGSVIYLDIEVLA